MIEIRKIGAQEARERCMSGSRLVCAYDSEDNFKENHLEGAISLDVLKKLVPQLSREEEMIFYCA